MKLSWFKGTVFLFLGNLLLSHQTFQDAKTTLIHKWKTVELEYVDEKTENETQPINIAITDADFYPAVSTGRIFVTSPQLPRPGIPATLYEVVGGLLRPFPTWPSKNVDNTTSCENAFSVYRIVIDKCGLLWVLDSGTLGSKSICKPKLLIYDLNKWDRLIRRYEFPSASSSDRSAVVTERSSLTNIIIESYRNDCSDSIAYIADNNDHGLIVYDLQTTTSWRIESSSFYPSSNEAQHKSSQLMSGLSGLALSPASDRNRKLYFHSYNSDREAWTPVNVLKNRSAIVDPEFVKSNIVQSPGTRAGQSTVEVMTYHGILIYVLVTENALACWNSRTPYTIENQHILKKDDVNFQFISGLKLKNNKLLITSNRFQYYYSGKIDPNDYNYRIMVVEDVNRLLKNTPCISNSDLSDGITVEKLLSEVAK